MNGRVTAGNDRIQPLIRRHLQQPADTVVAASRLDDKADQTGTQSQGLGSE
jgi:hypothetical protein